MNNSNDIGNTVPYDIFDRIKRVLSKDNLIYYKDLLLVITKKEIKIRYKNSYFGYFWSVLNPLGFALVFYFVFKIVMRVKMDNYTLFLVTGLFPWQWIANATTASTTVYISNASIIKKVNFPRSIMPLAMVMQDMFHFCCSIPVIILFLLAAGLRPTIEWIYGVPILLIVHAAMVYGIALALSSLNLFFRDIEQIIPILLMFMFYPTPILYSIDMIPAEYATLINLDPFTPIIMCWRALFMHGHIPLNFLLGSIFYSLFFISIGACLYRKLRWKFAEVI